jgi:hypothetical protein
VPHLVLGTVLVLTCALAAVVLSVRAGGRVPVLALARDMSAGEVLTSADLQVVQVSAGSDLPTVSADDEPSLMGQPLTAPRPAGALLAPADVGSVRWPPAGRAIAAVALKAGAYPPGLTEGAKVAALVAPPSASAGSPSAASEGGAKAGTPGGLRATWLSGVIVSVLPDADDGDGSWGTGSGGERAQATGAVVSLLMDESAAATVGSAPAGTVSLVQLSPAAGSEGDGEGG